MGTDWPVKWTTLRYAICSPAPDPDPVPGIRVGEESAVILPKLKISSLRMVSKRLGDLALKDVDQSKPLERCALKSNAGRHDHAGDLRPAH
jgi:hypothetical protein